MTSFSCGMKSAIRILFFSLAIPLFAGCITGQTAPQQASALATPEVKIIRNPNLENIAVGQPIVLSAETMGVDLQFEWSAERGNLSAVTEPSTIYTAPNEPGIDRVTLMVSSQAGDTPETITFAVLDAPTTTPSARSTDATDAATSITSLCESLRPPIVGDEVEIRVEITSPKPCETLPVSISVGGIYTGDLDSKEIWILVSPETDSRYYPQLIDSCGPNHTEAAGGKWKSSANFGGQPQQYDVIAVVVDVDGEASQAFTDWALSGCETGEHPGFARNALPSGITELDSVTVLSGKEE